MNNLSKKYGPGVRAVSPATTSAPSVLELMAFHWLYWVLKYSAAPSLGQMAGVGGTFVGLLFGGFGETEGIGMRAETLADDGDRPALVRDNAQLALALLSDKRLADLLRLANMSVPQFEAWLVALPA